MDSLLWLRPPGHVGEDLAGSRPDRGVSCEETACDCLLPPQRRLFKPAHARHDPASGPRCSLSQPQLEGVGPCIPFIPDSRRPRAVSARRGLLPAGQWRLAFGWRRFRVISAVRALAPWMAAAILAVGVARQAPASEAAGPSAGLAGLAGDGKTDDTDALQHAVDAGVGAIRLGKGVYRITKPIVVDLDKVGYTSFHGDGVAQLVMEGPGPALRFVGTHKGTAGPDSFQENVWLKQRTPMIDGLEIVGRHPEASGVEVSGTMQLTISRLVVREALHGVRLFDRNRNVILSECHIYHNRGVGVLLDRLSLHQVNIANCHISYNAGGGVVVRESEIRNLQIACCDIEANTGEKGDPPSANILFDASVGSIREGAIVGCTLQHSAAPKESAQFGTPKGTANIRFIGASREQPHKVGNLAISDNLMSDVDTNIHMVHARGVTITGNSIHGAFSTNLLFEDCSNMVVASNLFDRNPDYGFDSPSGLVFRQCQDCTLTGLHINGVLDSPAGLLLENCRRFNIANCTILDCDHCGLLLKDVSHSRVSGCLIRDDRPDSTSVPLRVAGGDGNMIEGNSLGSPPQGGDKR